jgi:hypothetical protein
MLRTQGRVATGRAREEESYTLFPRASPERSKPERCALASAARKRGNLGRQNLERQSPSKHALQKAATRAILSCTTRAAANVMAADHSAAHIHTPDTLISEFSGVSTANGVSGVSTGKR